MKIPSVRLRFFFVSELHFYRTTFLQICKFCKKCLQILTSGCLEKVHFHKNNQSNIFDQMRMRGFYFNSLAIQKNTSINRKTLLIGFSPFSTPEPLGLTTSYAKGSGKLCAIVAKIWLFES